MEDTKVGRHLLRNRMRMVSGLDGESMLEIGIGAGGFVKMASCYGYDVNPKAVQWLKSRDRWEDIQTPVRAFDTVCFWDSLEHMMVPELAVMQSRRDVFMSLPIFESAEQALHSKHFKPNEHLWYFTERGIVGWMDRLGFSLVERNRDEERWGRDGIGSYHFTRK